MKQALHSPLFNQLIMSVLIIFSSCGVDKPESLVAAEELLPAEIDFNLHVKPILSDRCFACHGPDEAARKADLRLDIEEGAFVALGEEKNRYALSPGNLRKSEVYHRLISDDPDFTMPPPESNLSLNDQEKATIIRWIEQGAQWKRHWSFIPPEKADIPSVEQQDWPQNEIDNFVLAKMEQHQLQPNQQADQVTLLRRLYFDLTGLPPSPNAIDNFLKDNSPNAYEKVVDKLMSSHAYGERMAMEWMDVARYADSHGYHADGYRMMWPWRDWVIEAFNQNMPYDQFMTLQLAGDLLPDPDREQILATAFHRNHPMTAEGGIVDEEYRLEYVFDRTITTAKTFLGLTIECARCHDHKYDPISQKEFFQFSAYFNNLNELGMTGDDGNTGPMLKLTDKVTQQKLDSVKDLVHQLEQSQTQRLTELASQKPAVSSINLDHGLITHLPLDGYHDQKTKNLAQVEKKANVSGEPDLIQALQGKGLRFNGDHEFLALPETGIFEKTDPFSITVNLKPEIQVHYQEIFGNSGNKNSFWRGYECYLDSFNRVSVRLMHALPHNIIHITAKPTLPLNQWASLAVTYDGSSDADGLNIFIDGRPADKIVHVNNLYKSIIPVNFRYEPDHRPLRFSKSYRAFSGDDGVLQGSFDEIRIYDRQLSNLEVAKLAEFAGKTDPVTFLTLADTLQHYQLIRDPASRKNLQALRKLWQHEMVLMDSLPEIMVMKEMETPRATYVLERGSYMAPQEQVKPATPAAVGMIPDSLPKNRLGLANWLSDPANPLTARVTVNRYWHLIFGKGLVQTVDDFGNQGDLPTHPALLDWLAVDFTENGWNVKRLIKQMVMSNTYRQSSLATDELLKKDPYNHLLARGPKHRLQAEMIRDNALAASGLLVKKIGGPSAKPYQPEGLWIEKGTFSHVLLRYQADKGEGLYRRSMYTFIKRTSPPPNMTIFDMESRSTCVVSRQNTSTPLQSLVLLNDPQFVEAARIIAERMQTEGGKQLDSQLNYGFKLLTSRDLRSEELMVFKNLYQEEIEKFSKQPQLADSLLSVGDYPVNQDLEASNTAALAVVSNLMINHDAAYMKR